MKPCYLFGTMHSADKRVYYLGDSVYSSIQSCDGFAMELDPGDMIDSIININESDEFNVAYRQAIENDLVKKSPEYYNKIRHEEDSIIYKLKLRYNDLTQRDINRLEKAYDRRYKNDMRTKLDLFLFDLAKKQGKIVGGIEDVSDQTALKDELGNSFDPDEFLKNQRKKYADIEEWMIINYTEAELDKLSDFSQQGQTKRQMSLMLYNRNDKMARRIDSLGNIRSTFCAVGVAHLPGDSGLISLLRNKGYTVTPVFSSKKIAPGGYKIDNRLQTMMDFSDADSNYVVQLPGKPSNLTAITDKLSLKTYKELSNEILLMFGIYEDGDITKTIDNEVEEIKSFFSENDIKLFSANKIRRQELDGYDINFKSRDGYIRLHVFNNKGKTYLFAAGSKNKDSVNAPRCQNFLATYKMILNKIQTETTLLSFVSPDKAFSISLPTQPKKENIKGDATYTKEDITLFSSFDSKNKISYLVLLKEPFKGYFMDFDSTIFVQTVTEIRKGILPTAIAQETIMLDGYPALKVKIKGENDNKSQVIYSILTMRHNRLYNLTARGLALSENILLFDNFFNSFHFLPYLETKFEKQSGPDQLFSVNAPSPIYLMQNKIATLEKNNNTAASRRSDYYAFDNNTAMSYGITSIGFNKYYLAKDERSLLDDYARIHFNDQLAVNNIYQDDSLLYNKAVRNGGIEGRELLLKSLFNNTCTRLRIMHYGNAVFIINTKGDKELVTDKNADMFFNSFRFTNEQYETDVFKSKTTALVKDLQSTDTVLSSTAYAALAGDFKFPEQDLHLLLDALLYDYPVIKNKAFAIPELLSLIITAYPNAELRGFIKTNYPLLKSKREDLRLLMINILAASKSEEGFHLLKELLINDPPADGHYEIAMSYCSNSPGLAASLFPDLAIKLTDNNTGPFIADLLNMLLDSNKIQYSSIATYEDMVIKLGKKLYQQYHEYNNDNFYTAHTNGVLQLLARINKKQARGILNDFIDLQNNKLSGLIIVALIKNDQAVSSELIDKYCAKNELRIELYDELIKIGKQAAFKGEYASQRSFAEAFAMIYTEDEIRESIPKYYEIVAVKDETVNNMMSRFYIFKVTCQFRYSTNEYTCITGPFSTDASNFSIEPGKELFILYRTKFDTKNIDHLFADFIDKVRKGKK